MESFIHSSNTNCSLRRGPLLDPEHSQGATQSLYPHGFASYRGISSPPYPWFHFLQFQLPAARKYYMETSRKKQFISLKLCVILSSVIESHRPTLSRLRQELSFCPAHLGHIGSPPTGCLVAVSVIR